MNVAKEGVTIVLTWRTDDAEDVAKAQAVYTRLVRQGWLATGRNGRSRRVFAFPPDQGKLVFVPLSEGG